METYAGEPDPYKKPRDLDEGEATDGHTDGDTDRDTDGDEAAQ